ncbi:MAG TPA: hypothetical protein VLE95_00605 [Chlamydiales bacterium]|nr:hypothetical protein [Chlamydiales bacterium]
MTNTWKETMPGILYKVVQKWNMSDLSHKTAEFVLHVIWGGFFCINANFWMRVLIRVDPHGQEIFGMPIGLLNRSIRLLAPVRALSPRTAPAA